jgi:hypothetical protein
MNFLFLLTGVANHCISGPAMARERDADVYNIVLTRAQYTGNKSFTQKNQGTFFEGINDSKIQSFKDSGASNGDNCRGYAHDCPAQSIRRKKRSNRSLIFSGRSDTDTCRSLIYPCRSDADTCRSLIYPCRNDADTCRSLIYPCRNGADACRSLIYTCRSDADTCRSRLFSSGTAYK